MSALDDVRADLADALDALADLKGYAKAPGEVVAPAAVVIPSGWTEATLDNSATYTLLVQFLVPMGDWPKAQADLDALVAHDGTAVAAIHAADIEARVVGMEQYGVTQWGLTEYMGAQLTVEVYV